MIDDMYTLTTDLIHAIIIISTIHRTFSVYKQHEQINGILETCTDM